MSALNVGIETEQRDIKTTVLLNYTTVYRFVDAVGIVTTASQQLQIIIASNNTHTLTVRHERKIKLKINYGFTNMMPKQKKRNLKL